MGQVQKAKADQKQAEETTAETVDKVETPAADEVDDLLADIDDVLEENAEVFVAQYQQKGGE